MMRWADADGKPADYDSRIEGVAVLSDKLAPKIFEKSGHRFDDLLKAENAGDPLPTFTIPVEAELRTRTAISALSSPNVVGRLPGTDLELAEQAVVLLAHLDHLGVGAAVEGDAVYNGAYDNAMGVGLIIETARALQKIGTRRSVIFAAVTAEERGLLGSHYLATHPPVPQKNMTVALTLDMPLLLFPMKEVIGFGREHSNIGGFVDAAAAAEGVDLADDPMPDEVLFVRSDHYSFVREGIPGLFFFPGFRSSDPELDGSKLVYAHLATHYHKPSDDMMRPVHWPSAERFARINTRLAKLMADSDVGAQWNAGNFFAEKFAIVN